jgi:hypothetical protein
MCSSSTWWSASRLAELVAHPCDFSSLSTWTVALDRRASSTDSRYNNVHTRQDVACCVQGCGVLASRRVGLCCVIQCLQMQTGILGMHCASVLL